jgi:septal ring factor EnvC (AmiA/AmiB activator)
LFDNVGTVSLSYHNLTDKVDAMITQRIDNLVMRRLDSVLSRLEGGSQEATPLPATTIEENEAPDDELGEMRELWFEACDQLSEARQEAKEHWQRFKNAQKELSEAKQDVTALTKDFAQLQKTLKAAQNGLADASSQIKELEKEKMSEGPSRNDKGERVYKSELALAVRHLVMTAGMSQKDVGELLGLSTSEVSQLKNKGTKLHQKRAKSE